MLFYRHCHLCHYGFKNVQPFAGLISLVVGGSSPIQMQLKQFDTYKLDQTGFQGKFQTEDHGFSTRGGFPGRSHSLRSQRRMTHLDQPTSS